MNLIDPKPSRLRNQESHRCRFAMIDIIKRIGQGLFLVSIIFPQFRSKIRMNFSTSHNEIILMLNEELIAITEGKQKDLVAGFMQNIMQLESSHHTNTRKRKASVAFDDEFDYLYGIVTTGRACVIFFL